LLLGVFVLIGLSAHGAMNRYSLESSGGSSLHYKIDGKTGEVWLIKGVTAYRITHAEDGKTPWN
jgi:hypothetical protein